MKKFLKFLVLLLVLPISFSFAGCKKDKDKGNDNSGTPGIETPANPDDGDDGTGDEDQGGSDDGTGDEGGSDEGGTGGDGTGDDNPDDGGSTGGGDSQPEEPGEPEVYYHTANFEYKLPTGYEHLLADKQVSKEVSQNIDLPTVADTKLNEYFLGWFDSLTNNKVSSAIVGAANQRKTLYAKWDETNLKKYYYTAGLTFGQGVDTESNNVATIASYFGQDENVIIPLYYEVEEGTELPVRIIAENAFKNTGVKSLTQNIEGLVVEQYAFAGSQLENFDFSKTYRIDAHAFENTKLTSIEMGAYLRLFGEYVFANNTKLTSVNISKVTNTNVVSQGMFSGCEKLVNINLGNAITNISQESFKNCSSLVNIDFIKTKITTINNNAFENCSSIQEVTVSNSVTSFGYNVFSGCSSLKTLKMYQLFKQSDYDTLTTFMGNLASSVTKIELVGTNILEIPTRYFENLSKLKEIVIPNNVTTIGAYAFAGCAELATLSLPTSLDFDTFTLNAVSDTAWYKNLTDILYVGDILYLVPGGVSGAITIKDGTKTILESAFYENTKITSVTIPSSVEIIGAYAFANCSNLKTVNFEQNTNLTAISDYAFNRCTSLDSINLGNCTNVTTIGEFAFGNISNIATFTLPAGLETLSSSAFYNASVGAFAIDASNTNFMVESGVVYNKAQTNLLVYPKAKTSDMFEIPETVTSVSAYAFAYNSSIEYIYVQSDVTFDEESLTGAGTGAVAILTESDNIVTSNEYVYNLLDQANYTYTKNGDEFDFNVTFEGDDGLHRFFVKFSDSDKTYCYQIFVIVSGETSEVVEQIDISEHFN